MISAFGVEHTEISKGLPSALRAKNGFKVGEGAGTLKRVAMEQKVSAHQAGKGAAKHYGKAKKSGYEPAPSFHSQENAAGDLAQSLGRNWSRKSKTNIQNAEIQGRRNSNPWAKRSQRRTLP